MNHRQQAKPEILRRRQGNWSRHQSPCMLGFWAFNLCRRAGYRLTQDRLILFMVYFVLVWVNTLGEDALEKPYITIPYYFFGESFCIMDNT